MSRLLLSIVILLILAYGFYAGSRRGVVLELIYTIAYALVLIIAIATYAGLWPKFQLIVPYPSAILNSKFAFFNLAAGLTLDKSFYAGFAFLFVLFVGWLVIRFVMIFAHRLTYLDIKQPFNKIAGGILGLIVTYIGLFFIIYLLALIPINTLQEQLAHSPLSVLMVKYTPFFSSHVHQWWIDSILK